jgi:hypothetical protein
MGASQDADHVILIGALAQLGERLICIQEVRSSILLGSTIGPAARCQQDQPEQVQSRSPPEWHWGR